uniref:Uncharacterized protein n=1 Tax=Aegilops tauschii subsp. strangulata TaxID=200361 RepID=A0A452Y5C2_AEGTS
SRFDKTSLEILVHDHSWFPMPTVSVILNLPSILLCNNPISC